MDISKGRYWDKPWGLVSSCTRCSDGCKNCWSLAMEKRFHKGVEGKIQIHPDRLDIPLKRKKPTVWAIWNDLFHEDVPDEFISKAYRVMVAEGNRHTYLVLTKRPQNMATTLFDETVPENIYHGLTVCNQQEADEKIPIFLQVPGRKFLSIEPCLSNVSLWETWLNVKWVEYFDVVILGGETGPGARPMHPDWVRSIRDQCQAAGVPFFFKGWGRWRPRDDGSMSSWVALDPRLLDGRTHDDLPWRQHGKG